ncbi:hypothetical protein [Variovorax sp. JS1663]|uniref:hypothetical protein n=1 Tax=Variovorax sp. JS1663 TaxID=1851577 RepID=UPI000B34720C|nr:hypothetical protein [Variovorax sp. JS1663]OUM03365.1 hypothetical protein A8M77_06860 [Variovorax sp. JS1663]
MRFARRPSHARALLCVLAFALWLATTLGLMHRTLHGHALLHAPAAVAGQGEAGDAGHGLSALFGGHGSDADCRLYDQLSHGPAALCVPALMLPVQLPAATFLFLEGEALARWVALFDARGPPATR